LELKGKAAIVTGASRRIGAAIAIALGQKGAAVVINYFQNKDLAEQVASEVKTAGGQAIIHGADVRDREAVDGMVARAVDAFGGVDILVNNARIMHKRHSFLSLDWEKDMVPQLEMHLGGAFHCCQAAIPHMINRGGGAIVNLLSTAYRKVSPNVYPYGSAKAALRFFTMNLAHEMGPHGIRVNSVSPATTETKESPLPLEQEERERRLREVPLGRFASPNEMAEAVLFLCSEKSSYVSGVDLAVSGGWSLSL